MSERMEGVVKWFSAEKGYGFIKQGEDQPDIFVHYSAISGTGYRSLGEGDRVTFEVVDGRKGMQAAEVEIVERANE